MTKTVWPTGTKNRLPGTSKKKKRLNLTLQNMDFFVVVVIISESENGDCMDYTVHGILQPRIPEWEPIPFSRGSSQPEIKLGSLALQADSSIIIRRVVIGANNLSLLIC